MTKWATIDKGKLEKEIDRLAAQLAPIEVRGRVVGHTAVAEYFALRAEHNALLAVFNALSRP